MFYYLTIEVVVYEFIKRLVGGAQMQREKGKSLIVFNSYDYLSHHLGHLHPVRHWVPRVQLDITGAMNLEMIDPGCHC